MTGLEVTFETKTWQGDLHVVLDPYRLASVISANEHEFPARVLYVNNVEDPSAVMRRARSLVRSGVLTDVVLVRDYAKEALTAAGLTPEDLGRGYVYSIAELVGLYLCPTPNLLHFSSDSRLSRPVNWLPTALGLLKNAPEVAVVNLVWNGAVDQVLLESTSRDDDFAFGFGFSDQMYLVRRAEFVGQIYHHDHPSSARYPSYGGMLFERRVDSWMRSTNRLRATWLHGSYFHENITRPSPLRQRVAHWARHNARGR